jgi:hypothetical protein
MVLMNLFTPDVGDDVTLYEWNRSFPSESGNIELHL